MGRLFIARIPQALTERDLQAHFGRFGTLEDVYIPRASSKRPEHRGFGFVTFSNYSDTDGVVETVMQRQHVLHGHELAVDRAAPKVRFHPVCFFPV